MVWEGSRGGTLPYSLSRFNIALQSDSRAIVGALRALLFDAAAAERKRYPDESQACINEEGSPRI